MKKGKRERGKEREKREGEKRERKGDNDTDGWHRQSKSSK